jgi:LPS sulfotransferase NodH
MHNRWCIFTAPRSGSTWLEHSIHAALQETDARAEKLMEIIHPKSSLHYTTIINNNTLTVIHRKQYNLLNKYDIYHNAYKLIKQSDPMQSLTCRVFNQEHFSSNEYLNFLLHLQEYGFKIVNLERDLLDRTISLYFANETNVWHRINNSLETDNEADTCKLTIDIPTFVYFYIAMLKDNVLRQVILKNLSHIKINYETLDQDIILHNIPFKINMSVTYLKTYKKPYKDLIINYDEMIGAVKDVR